MLRALRAVWPGTSRATVGHRETFFWGEKIFEFIFIKWRIQAYFIFFSDGVPLNVGGNFPLPYSLHGFGCDC